MSNTQRQSRPAGPSLDESVGASSSYPKLGTTAAGAGAKRLFSNRDSRRPEEQGENAVAQMNNEDDDTPTNKRYRSAEWPLTNSQTPQDAPHSRAPLRNRNSQNSSNTRRLSPPTRPSKFVEGSMNDRVSNKPPTPYLGDGDELLSEYDAGIGGRGSVLSSRADSNRHSIYRFGKSIASSFNPTNWKIWSKEKHTEEEDVDEESAQAKAMRESKEKAERIYRELKESGRFRDAAHVSQTAYQLSQPSPEKRESAKHDSGVEFGDSDTNVRYSRETSRDNKRMGRVFLETPLFQQPAGGYSPAASNASGSVARSESSSPSKQSFMFKKGSLSNINGYFKKPSLSNIKKSFMGESRESLAYPSTTDLHHQARRIPSRKDLQKQQKLVKRVSDLEGKLEAARRQLCDALGEPVPALPAAPVECIGRARFIPGALASLPSERLLSGYVDPDEADLDDSSFEAHMSRDTPSMPGARGTSVLRTEAPQKDIVLPSVEIQSQSKDSQEVHEKKISRESLLTATTSISEPTTNAMDPNDADNKDGGSHELGDASDKEATPKASRPRIPSKKRKSAFVGLADDGGKYKPSEDGDETDESEIKKMTPNPLRQKTPASVVRSNKLQKTTPTKAHSPPQNSRVSATRVRAKPASIGIQAPARRSSIQATTMTDAPTPARKLSKVHPPSQKEPQQSVNSPPSSPSFMGMKYENPTSTTPKFGSRAASPTSGRINPHNLVYSADPNTESDIPPMPPLPKNIRLASGEVINTSTSATAVVPKPQPHLGHKKLTKSRTPSPKKQDSQEKKPFEWPEDVF